MLIQAFERRVLTYVPTNPNGFQVEMGNIGQHYYDWRYNGGGKPKATATAAPTDTPAPPAPTATPIRARGGPVTLNGAGTTFPAPIYTKWFQYYSGNVAINITFNYQPIGSGGGISAIAPILLLGNRPRRLPSTWTGTLGPGDHLARPFNLAELLELLRAILRARDSSTFACGPDSPSFAASPSLGLPYGSVQVLPAPSPPRVGPNVAAVLLSGDLVISLAAHTVTRAGQPIQLKPQEFDLLAFFAQHPGRVFSRTVLLQHVWGHTPGDSLRTVDVHVHWLRAKLEPVPGEPLIIQTVHGVGYRFSRLVQSAPG